MEAEKGGARRVELCSRLEVGGVTPGMEMVKKVIDNCQAMDVNVLVRPREGGFTYNEEELLQIESSINECRSLGVKAVVIGVLTTEGQIDMTAMKRLISVARPMEVTFHRAFDECADPRKALEDIISLGCERLLTSGHEENALTGRSLIAELVRQARGRIVIMAGAGVRPDNIAILESETHADEFHSSSRGCDGRVDREIVRQLCQTR